MRNACLYVWIGLLFLLSPSVGATNTMSLPHISGNALSQVELSVSIDNTDNFVGFQLDIPLPAGITYVSNSIILNPARSNGHTVSVGIVNNNILRIIAFSVNNNVFYGNSGAVATLSLQLHAQAGVYPLLIQNAVISSANAANILHTTSDGSLTVLAPGIQLYPTEQDFGEVPLGETSDRYFQISNTGNQPLQIQSIDINHPDFEVMGATSFSIAPGSSHSLQLRFHSVIKGAYEQRMTITSNDLSEPIIEVNLYAIAFTVNELYCGNMQAASGTQQSLSLSINNMELFVGFQFDLILPEPLTYINGSCMLNATRITDHQVTANMVGANTLRVVAFSPTNSFFIQNEGQILQLGFQVEGTGGWYPLSLTNVIIGNEMGQNILSANYNGWLEITAADIYCNQWISFGNVAINESAVSSPNVYNYGQENLIISSVSFSDKDFASSTNFPLTIAPNQYKTLSLSFNPSTIGNISSQMKIFSNDPDENPYLVQLEALVYSPNYLMIDDLTTVSGTTDILTVSADNYDAFVGFQMDIVFPTGIQYLDGSAQLSNRKQDHILFVSELTENSIRLVSFSPTQKAFIGNSGKLVQLSVVIDDNIPLGTYEVGIQDALMGDQNSQNILWEAINGSIMIVPKPPSSFHLLEPEDEVVLLTPRPVFKWETSTDLQSGLNRYELNISGFSPITIPHTETQYSPDFDLPNNYYSWFVQAYNNLDTSTLSNTYSFTIAVPLPGVSETPVGQTELCQGSLSTVYTTSGATNATSYSWQLMPEAAGSIVAEGNSATVTWSDEFSGMAEIRVKGVNSAGEGSFSEPLMVMVYPATQAGSMSGNNTICFGETTGLISLDNYTGAILKWQKRVDYNNWIDIANSTSSYSEIPATKGVWEYRAEVQSGACMAEYSTIATILVLDIPDAASSITGSPTVCQGEIGVIYSVEPILEATSYEWTLPNGAIGTSSTNTISVDFGLAAVSGTISVKGINTCGEGESSSIFVTVNPLPAAAGTISGSTTVCQGESNVIYSVGPVAEATSYEWTLPNGATGNSSTNSIFVDFGLAAVSGTISVKGINACGEGASSSIFVTVNPLPAAAGTISGSTTVCQGESNVIYSVGPVAEATSYEWTLPNGATGTSSTNTISVDFGLAAVSGTISVKGINSCGEGDSSTMFITVNEKPPTPTISIEEWVLYSDAPEGNQWYDQNGPIAGATESTYLVTQDGVYYTIVTLLNCSSDASNEIEVVGVGIETVSEVDGIRIYPNPVKKELIIESDQYSGQISFEIMNIMGQILVKDEFMNRTVIQTQGFHSGLYIIRCKYNNQIRIWKVVKE